MGDATDDLADLWRWFGEQQFHGYSPLYERIARAVADDRSVLGLLREAPPAAHLPLAPLAAVRYLLLDGVDHPLGQVYSGASDADPGPLFLDLCRRHRTPLLALLKTRRVQTNDCGRSALIGPALTWVSQQRRGPYCLVDVGASAGLNLLCDRYRMDYGDHGTTGPPDSPVRISCDVIGGHPPIAGRLPQFVRRVGIDLSPVDVSDPSDARWLLACVWPDTGRAGRVEASIQLAQQSPPMLIAGRANDVLLSVLRELPTDATAVVLTTWALAYFSNDERTAFVDLLRTESENRRVVWVSAESSGVVEALGAPDPGQAADDVLGAMLIDDGLVTARVLARVHSHGNWLQWLPDRGPDNAA